MGSILDHVAPEAVGFALTLALSLLIGLEREEHAPESPATHFGGVRTYPIFGFGGFLLVLAFPDSALPFAVGLAALAALLTVSHWVALRKEDPGLTSEAAALLTFTLGAAAAVGLYWISVATGVVTVILLQEKRRLEGLAARLPRDETRTLARFLLVTAVILPAVPNQSFTRFEINPFTFWLVVVAVSGVSYASYLLQLWLGHDRGLLLSGILGGAYSSTVTTVVMARRSRHHPTRSRAYAGAIIAATGVMYLRLWALVRLFAPDLAARLLLTFAVLGVVGLGAGAFLTRRGDGQENPESETARRNPLELSSAVAFSAVFLAVLVVTRLVSDRFGDVGVLVMAAIMGAADVDPFILGLTQVAGETVRLDLASLAIVIAAGSNNILKGVYAVLFGDRHTGGLALGALTLLGAAGVALYLLT